MHFERDRVSLFAIWIAFSCLLEESIMNDVNGLGDGNSGVPKDIRTVSQIIDIILEENKYKAVKDVINYLRPDDKVVIFCSNKARAVDLSIDLEIELRRETICIQSRQIDCVKAIADFNSGRARILIATDIALQRLNVVDVTHVVNYDFPHDIDEYVHHVRRFGSLSTCISFVTLDDRALSAALIHTLKEFEQEIPEELYDMARDFVKWKMTERAEMERNNIGKGRRGYYHRLRNYE